MKSKITDKSLLLDVIHNAIEYSCRGFWCQIDTFRWYWWYESDGPADPNMEKVAVDWTTPLMGFRDDEDGKADFDRRPFVYVSLADIRDATMWALENYNHLFTFYVNGGIITEIDYDAVGADVILQKAVLGEVIYG